MFFIYYFSSLHAFSCAHCCVGVCESACVSIPVYVHVCTVMGGCACMHMHACVHVYA